MRKLSLFIAIGLFCQFVSAQTTNTFPSSGNVGIGTTSPEYALDIIGTGFAQSTILITRNDNAHGWGPAIFLNASSDDDDGAVTQSNRSLGAIFFRSDYGAGFKTGASIQSFNTEIPTSTSSGGKLLFLTTPNGSTISTTSMTIGHDGKVGIGTDTPFRQVQIESDYPALRLRDTDDGNGATAFIEFGHTEAGAWERTGLIGDYFTNQDMIGIGADAGNDIGFGVNGNHPYYDANLYIKASNGFVGIGTNTPCEMLTVNGKILATEIEVVSAVCSDYIFEEDYKLRSLEDVEQFVKENKHLPEIPSMQEFAENGQNLAETQDLLLRKIEELTLYVIEQNKEIIDLKNEMSLIK